jgi:predicted Holliday junction resolvase-like endonuclease
MIIHNTDILVFMELPHNILIVLAVIAVFAVAACAVCLIIGLRVGTSHGRKLEEADWKAHKLEATVAARLKQSRAVLGGLVSEQMAPLLPGFPYDPGDCRFIGKPIDFIVFRGMNEKDIQDVVFLEVKTGAHPALNEQEKRLRDAIQAGRVIWDEIVLG